MRMAFLDNITGFGDKDWTKQWILAWFVFGVLALFVGFWRTTEHAALDWFYFGVSILGLLCVLGLSFRRNFVGNGFGMLATAGEVVVQGTSGAVGLMLAPLFNFFSHAYALKYWAKNTNGNGEMIPKSATKSVWIITLVFIILGLSLFPVLNDFLIKQGYGIIDRDGSSFLGRIDFFWINVVAFVLSITAQVTMILRYSFNWGLWIVVNFVWLIVNIMSGNYIFAIQTLIYQLNAMVGLYGWQRSEERAML